MRHLLEIEHEAEPAGDGRHGPAVDRADSFKQESLVDRHHLRNIRH